MLLLLPVHSTCTAHSVSLPSPESTVSSVYPVSLVFLCVCASLVLSECACGQLKRVTTDENMFSLSVSEESGPSRSRAHLVHSDNHNDPVLQSVLGTLPFGGSSHCCLPSCWKNAKVMDHTAMHTMDVCDDTKHDWRIAHINTTTHLTSGGTSTLIMFIIKVFVMCPTNEVDIFVY